MAVGTPTLPTPAIGATATNVTTASFTPAASVLLIAYGQVRGSGVTNVTIADSLGGTWTDAGLFGQDANVLSRVWYQVAGGSPSAMTVTVTGVGSTTQACIAIAALTGAGTDFSNAAVVSGLTQNPTASIPGTTASDSTGLCFFTKNAPGTITGPSGYSVLTNSNLATNIRLSIWYDVGSPLQAQNITTSNSTSYVVQSVEVKVPASAAITGTVAQTITRAAQAATGTAQDQFTGTIAQTTTIAAQSASGTYTAASAFQSDAFQASPAFQIPAVVIPAVTGTIAQAIGIASQAASGTVTAAAAVTGTIVQATGSAAQAAAGAVAPAVTGTVVQTTGSAVQAASGTSTAPAAVTGTIAQGPSVAQQSAVGIVAVAGAITGLIIQTAPVAVQSATGSVTAAAAVSGTIAQATSPSAQAASGTVTPAAAVSGTIVQSAPSAQQAASGLVAAAGSIVGTIVQTAPSAQQAALGTVTGAVVPDTRPIGGFAGWSEEAEEARRKYQRRKRKAEIELRELIEATARGEKYPPAPVIEAVAALADLAADSLLLPPELGDLRAQVALLEMTLRRVLEEENLRQMIAAQRLIEEEAMITLLLVA